MRTPEIGGWVMFANNLMRAPRMYVREGQLAPGFHLRLGQVPRYIVDRARMWLNDRQNPDKAWLTADAVRFIESWIRPTHSVFEYGAGGSTVWFAGLAAHVTSVDANEAWAAAVNERLVERHLGNSVIHVISPPAAGFATEQARQGYIESYVNAAPELAPGSQSLVLVDGGPRDHCALRALDLVAPGGLIVIDNANYLLPSPTRTPRRVARPASPAAQRFAEAVADWRCHWTTNGVWDTAIWFKPEA